MIWEEANLFVYKWVVRQGVWFWAMGAGYSGAFGTEDIPKHYVLLIQYDQQDRVRRFERKVGPGKPWGDFLQDWVRSSDHKPLEAQAVEGSNDK